MSQKVQEFEMSYKTVWIGTLALVMALLVFAGCSQKSVRSDAQVASDVQNKIYSDAAVQSRDISVQANAGAVTLNGNVSSDAERGAAANDAAAVSGVKTVVNNLQVQQAQATPPAETSPAPPKREAKRTSTRSESTAHQKPVVAHENSNDQPLLARNTPPEPAPVQQSAPGAAPMPPPPPPKPQKVTIPAGTQLTVRLSEPLDSERNQVGDTFRGTLGSPIVIDDQTVVPIGTDVTGRVAAVQSAGRFAGKSLLTLELTSLSMNGRTYNVQTNQWSRQGKGEATNTAVKAGGGAALGAIIGGLASGGRGAAIGAAAGGAAGTGVAATKKGQQIKLGTEATLNFQLLNTLTVTPQSTNDRDTGRTPLG
jgi:hypothetical protein